MSTPRSKPRMGECAGMSLERGRASLRSRGELEQLVGRVITLVLGLAASSHADLLQGAQRRLVVDRGQRDQPIQPDPTETVRDGQERRLSRDASVPLGWVDDAADLD